MSSKPGPVSKVQFGKINVAIWANQRDGVTFHSATLEKRYCDAEGNWKSTDSLNRDECLVAAEALRQAALQMFDNHPASNGDADDASP